MIYEIFKISDYCPLVLAPQLKGVGLVIYRDFTPFHVYLPIYQFNQSV